MDVTLEDAKNDLLNFISELEFIKHISDYKAKFMRDRINMLFDATEPNPEERR